MSKQTDEVIVLLAASGVPTGEIARRVGYTPGGITEAIKRLDPAIQERRGYLDTRAILNYAALHECLDVSIKNIQRVVSDPDHPKNTDSSWKVIDKFMPTIQVTQNQTEHRLAPETLPALAQFVSSLDRLRGAHPVHDIESDPHVMQGEEALPKYDVEPAGGPVGE